MTAPVPEDAPVVERPSADIGDRLTVLEKQLAWSNATLHTTASTVQRIAQMFDMIVQGLMASPMGGMIKKQMEGMNRGN